MKLIRSQFISNTAANGGAVAVIDAGVTGTGIETISGCYFYDNQCIAAGHVKAGGAIWNQGGIIKAVEDCVFESNFAGYPTGRGDDIYASSGSLLILRNSHFLTPEVWTNNIPNIPRPRVFGDIPTCNEQIDFPVCPNSSKACFDNFALPESRGDMGTYGVICKSNCYVGYYGVEGSCVACPSGKYGIAHGINEGESCALCPAGKSNPLRAKPASRVAGLARTECGQQMVPRIVIKCA